MYRSLGHNAEKEVKNPVFARSLPPQRRRGWRQFPCSGSCFQHGPNTGPRQAAIALRPRHSLRSLPNQSAVPAPGPRRVPTSPFWQKSPTFDIFCLPTCGSRNINLYNFFPRCCAGVAGLYQQADRRSAPAGAFIYSGRLPFGFYVFSAFPGSSD